MEFRNLDYFLRVVDAGSLRGAAHTLQVTQPALTKAVRRLEDSLGVPLFTRQARGVTLTIYGESLLRHARELKHSQETARDEIEALRTGVTGLIRVGIGPSWQEAIVPDAIEELCATRPGVRVRVVGGGDDTLKSLLKAGSLDVVIAAVPDTPRLEPAFVSIPLLSDVYRVFADIAHPLHTKESVTLEDLLLYPWILPPPTAHKVQRLRLLFRNQGLPAPDPVIETDVIPLKFALMRDSPYLTFHAAAHLAICNPGFLLPLQTPQARIRRDAGIITRRGEAPSPTSEAFIRILRNVAGSFEPLEGRTEA